MNPKHTNPLQALKDGKEAHAPYNFVPLPDKIVFANDPLSQEKYHENALTGWIDCEICTCAPTYIRGMLTDEQYRSFGQKKPDAQTLEEKAARAPFYSSTEDKKDGFPVPAIPGSSLRGMIRSIVEIVSHGRMRWVASSPTFTYRAVAAKSDDPLRGPYEKILGRFGSNVKAGYLKRIGEEWSIQPAMKPQDLGLQERNPFLKVKEIRILSGNINGYIRLDSPDYKPDYFPITFDAEVRPGKFGKYTAVTAIGGSEAGYEYKGVLVCSGNMMETNQAGDTPRKSHTILLLGSNASPIPIEHQVIKDYLNGLTPFQKENLWGDEQGCLKEGAPVFYVLNNGKIIEFGHSPNFRVRAQYTGADHASTPADFVPNHLANSSAPDLADAIYGWVNEKSWSTIQRAGRVFFEDARFIRAENAIWLSAKPIPLHTLASPKPSTFQHYLVQDRDHGHDPDNKASLAHYGMLPDETTIRGYKLYWHKGDAPDIEASAKELQHETQLTRVVPLAAGVHFSFKIRFENLRDEELGALLWALALPGDSIIKCRHKIGMGKPLGMGAVKIDSALIITDRAERYMRLFSANRWNMAAKNADIKPFLAAFEQFVLKKLGAENSQLAELDRVKMLLAMMEWHESTPSWFEKTRYMEIEHGLKKTNEYKERPVLPDPITVASSLPTTNEQRSKPPMDESPRSSPIKTGMVNKWNVEKGYGQISQEDGTIIFVHYSGIQNQDRKSIREGQRVQYSAGKDMKGRPTAKNVKPA